MTAATTYTTLKSDIQSYCERNDTVFTSQIPRFIALAENRLASEDKPLGTLQIVTGNFSGGTLAKPVRWRKTKSLSFVNALGERRYLLLRGHEYCRAYWPNEAMAGVPEYYADYGYEHHLIVPTPDASYQFQLQYYERPEPLSDVNQTNWYTRYAPQLLLYASMMEAMPFLKTSERLPEFQALYNQALAAVKLEDGLRVADAAAVRS